MLPITAIYNAPERDYEAMVKNLKTSADLMGYDLKIYNVAEDPMRRYKDRNSYDVTCYFKPRIIQQALREVGDILWIDSDCLFQGRVDELLQDCDVAVTLRRFNPTKIRSIEDGYINAGVMAFRNNERVHAFIEQWIENTKSSRWDQDAMNKLLLRYSDLTKHGIENIGGIKVNIVSCDIYNYFYFDDNIQQHEAFAKILHVKGSLRDKHYNRIVKRLLQDKGELICQPH